MRIIKTLRTHRPSYSTAERTLNLQAPKSWKEMTQEQLRYVLHLLATFHDEPVMVKTYMLCHFTGLKIGQRLLMPGADGTPVVVYRCRFRTAWWRLSRSFLLQSWQVQSLLHQFDFIDQYDGMDVRLDTISGCRAVDDELRGYPFRDYLTAEMYYQMAIETREEDKITKLARQLYRLKNGEPIPYLKKWHLSAAEQLGTLMWFARVKSLMAQEFPNFFRRTEGTEMEGYDLIAARNAQIRALTEGDITKEAAVMEMDCWRALTELDQKAREAREFKEKYGNK